MDDTRAGLRRVAIMKALEDAIMAAKKRLIANGLEGTFTMRIEVQQAGCSNMVERNEEI